MDVVSNLRKLTDRPIVAGNVVTAEGAADLIKAGVQAIKVGVGPGSICTTRVISGVGMPQFTAIQEVASVGASRGRHRHCGRRHPLFRRHCQSPGRRRRPGDAGGLLAGTEESPGKVVHYQGRHFKQYRGMGSLGAMRRGSGDRYGQNSSGKLVAEGVEARVPYKGMLADVVFQLMGGLRSGMGYLGAHNLEELRNKARFVQITSGGLKESHPHDITITEEPVNYSC